MLHINSTIQCSAHDAFVTPNSYSFLNLVPSFLSHLSNCSFLDFADMRVGTERQCQPSCKHQSVLQLPQSYAVGVILPRNTCTGQDVNLADII